MSARRDRERARAAQLASERDECYRQRREQLRQAADEIEIRRRQTEMERGDTGQCQFVTSMRTLNPPRCDR